MEQRLPVGPWAATRPVPRAQPSLLAGFAAGLVVVLAVSLWWGIAFVRALPSPALDLALTEGEAQVAPAATLVLETIGWGTSLDDVRLIEFPLDAEGNVTGQRDVAVRYQPITDGGLPGETRGVLERVDGHPLLALDAWYELTIRGTGRVASWRGLRTTPLVVERAFGTARTPYPRFAPGVKLTYGEPLAIGWNVPIAEFAYRLHPDVPTRSWLSEDGTVAYIALAEFQQEADYALHVTHARAATGVPLRAPIAGTFSTPPALRVTGVWPENGARDVAPGLDPVLTFSAPVANPEAADEAIQVEPAVAGTFRWLAPNRVEFVTEKGFPYSREIRLVVQPGPDGLRSDDGGYVEEAVSLAYRTRVHKQIDDDLARQVVTLLEDGRAVYTTLAATGVKGAETPIGSYRVQYKLPKTRMRGTYPDGRTYDVPDVPWVMALFGDYALHGAPWRDGWGRPASNGCVSMPAAAAKYVYDWAPVGTPVVVHY